MYPFEVLPSNIYWAQNEEKKAQKFYITLCIYISAVSDYFIGLDLKEQGKLNWSVMASYYSIVHSARMIIFAIIGDYPKQHNKLSSLFNQKVNSEKNFKCNWLQSFDSYYSKRSNSTSEISLSELIRHYAGKLEFHNLETHIGNIGGVINVAINLRNDSNYEALLMAHEYHHEYVTERFNRLTRIITEGARKWIVLSTQCLKKYVENDKLMDEKRDVFKYYIHDYGREYLKKSLRRRIKDINNLDNLEEILKQLKYEFSREEINEFEEDYEILKNNISMKTFNKKTKLMKGFNEKIQKLEEEVR